MMVRWLAVTGLCLVFLPLRAAEGNLVIPGASYFINGRIDHEHGRIEPADFYSHDGELLRRVYCTEEGVLASRIDPSAPKPQPVRYAFASDTISGRSVSVIQFFDKHGQVMAFYLFDQDREIIRVPMSGGLGLVGFTFDRQNPAGLNAAGFPLDLSRVSSVQRMRRHRRGCLLL